MPIHTMLKILLTRLEAGRAGGAALLAAAMTVIGAGAQAAPITVTSVADFNAAVGSATTTTDTFSNDIPGGVEITFDSGVVSTLAGDFLEFARGQNLVRRQIFHGEVYDHNLGPLTLTWTFPMPVIGFVAEFGVERDGSVKWLDVTIPGSGQFFDINTEIGGGGHGVFGLVDTAAPFTQIQFSIQDGELPSNFFRLDNLTFAAAPAVVAVPEPGTLALFGLGLAGLALASAAATGSTCRRPA